MKKLLLLLFLALRCAPGFFAQQNSLFREDRIGTVRIEMPADSFRFLLENTVADRYLAARFIFDDGQNAPDTVPNVGFRLRGNTSLAAQKKSFKISFNEFAAGREYQGVRKLNLRGQANDPTLVREKLFYEIWKNAGQPERRAAFVRLFVNGEYRGLYTNIEELDKQWLQRTYGNNDGNLYKCLWPADLVWLGPSPQLYKNVMHGDERAYRLVTNETADDYSRFVALVQAINASLSINYAENLRAILHVDGVLKSWAMDIATGNWDDYFYLKNNYYLYDNPASGRFEWMAYDTDNCIGIDWLDRDWAKRPALDWHTHSEPRPLATRLLAVPEFRERLAFHLDSISRFLTCPEVIFPRIDELHQFLTAEAAADPFRPLDFGYTLDQFHNGFTHFVDGHTPYGLKHFFQVRCDSTRRQIAGLVSAAENPGVFSEPILRVFPNPASETLRGSWPPGLFSGEILLEIFSPTGQRRAVRRLAPGETDFEISLENLPPGSWFLKMTDGAGARAVRFGVVK